MKRRTLGIAAAAAFAVASIGGTALADVEQPVEPGPGCIGQIVAATNQNSGANPDGSPNDINARGPGFVIKGGQVVKAAITGVRTECTEV